jgi:hypothetical protein
VVADIAKLSVGREEYYTRELATDHEQYHSPLAAKGDNIPGRTEECSDGRAGDPSPGREVGAGASGDADAVVGA